MTSIRLTSEQRKTVIVNAAVKIANEKGLFEFTRAEVADACAIKTHWRTIQHHFQKHDDLRKAVLEHPDVSEDVKATARLVGMLDDE